MGLRLFAKLFSRENKVGPDGYPVPPENLRYLISGERNNSRDSFLAMGQHCSQRIIDVLAQKGVDINTFHSILDFGCGCGRTIRWFHHLSGATLHGTDYNPKLIRWCRRNLPFATFGINYIEPPLTYEPEQFELVYAFSVFTHLPEALQMSWMKELSRILKPQGFLALSTLPLRSLPPHKQTREDLVVKRGDAAGRNVCLAYHSVAYVTQILAKDFSLAQFIESTGGQDFYLLQKCTGVKNHTR
jgi:trans-aconitate methyltransferase